MMVSSKQRETAFHRINNRELIKGSTPIKTTKKELGPWKQGPTSSN